MKKCEFYIAWKITRNFEYQIQKNDAILKISFCTLGILKCCCFHLYAFIFRNYGCHGGSWISQKIWYWFLQFAYEVIPFKVEGWNSVQLALWVWAHAGRPTFFSFSKSLRRWIANHSEPASVYFLGDVSMESTGAFNHKITWKKLVVYFWNSRCILGFVGAF